MNPAEKLKIDLPRKYETLLIGIDGCGGAGKSTLAKRIQEILPNVRIIQMDDFYYKDRFDWQRLERQVLKPISENTAAEYQIYDWRTRKLAGGRKIEIGGIVVIEGVYSTRSELADYYDYKIWVECPREIRLKRGIERDGEAMREKWENEWMPAEDFYVKSELPRERADLVLNGWK